MYAENIEMKYNKIIIKKMIEEKVRERECKIGNGTEKFFYFFFPFSFAKMVEASIRRKRRISYK